jgi:hypothetical protein
MKLWYFKKIKRKCFVLKNYFYFDIIKHIF